MIACFGQPLAPENRHTKSSRLDRLLTPNRIFKQRNVDVGKITHLGVH